MRRLLAALLLLAAPQVAGAHRFEHPKSLRLGVKGDRLVLAIAYDVNPGRDAARARALFDRDADGALDPKEQALLLDGLEQRARHFLEVELDGAAVDWKAEARTGHRLDRPAADDTTLGAALVYSAALPGGAAHRVTIRDRDRDAARHVPLVVDLAEGWRIIRASQGEWHPEVRRLRGAILRRDRPLELVIAPSVGAGSDGPVEPEPGSW